MIAVIKTGGKQYLVEEGDVLSVEKLDLEAGKSLKLETLMKADGDKLELGTPVLTAQVSAEVVSHGRGVKISVVKYKAKSRYTRRVGHRQDFTKIKIVKI
jgi:large subunit ribosomal protein L21